MVIGLQMQFTVVIMNVSNKSRLQNNTSIYIAELHAIFQALQHIQEQQLRRVVICTDSRSVAQSLATNCPSSFLLSNIINLHNQLANNDTQIRFVWIPSHSGIHGNEQADRLAKEALLVNNITHIPIEYQSIKASIRHATLKSWQIQWTNTHTGNSTSPHQTKD